MKLLLVDDDQFFRKFYSGKLAAEGFEVEIAAEGKEALARLTTSTPDVILLDLIMPQFDGFEVLKSLSQNPKLKSIPVIVFSTLSQEQDVERAKQLGARDFVNKSSLNFTTLVTKIKSFEKKQTL